MDLYLNIYSIKPRISLSNENLVKCNLCSLLIFLDESKKYNRLSINQWHATLKTVFLCMMLKKKSFKSI